MNRCSNCFWNESKPVTLSPHFTPQWVLCKEQNFPAAEADIIPLIALAPGPCTYLKQQSSICSRLSKQNLSYHIGQDLFWGQSPAFGTLPFPRLMLPSQKELLLPHPPVPGAGGTAGPALPPLSWDFLRPWTMAAVFGFQPFRTSLPEWRGKGSRDGWVNALLGPEPEEHFQLL